jgi:hypothetical protein|eukprot:COSAG01_NODE_25366_length_747_cov_1.219136_1_plen_47_part_00
MKPFQDTQVQALEAEQEGEVPRARALVQQLRSQREELNAELGGLNE